MQEVRIGEKYVFESAVYGGLYRHEVLAFEGETAAHGERYQIRAWRIEVTEKPGQFSTEEGPMVAWHEAEAIHRWYADRWS